MPRQTKDEAPLEDALHALVRAYEDAARAVESTADAQQAYRMATQLADLLREAAEAAARLRTRQAARIYEEEKLSLAGLANYLGVSKARAGQLIDAAKKENKERS